MAKAIISENKTLGKKSSFEILTAILEELRLLRQEFSSFVSLENLKDYSHPEKIKKSYREAVSQYPPEDRL
jgi:hypothetical protein